MESFIFWNWARRAPYLLLNILQNVSCVQVRYYDYIINHQRPLVLIGSDRKNWLAGTNVLRHVSKRDPDSSSRRSERIHFTLTDLDRFPASLEASGLVKLTITDPDHLTKGQRMKKRSTSALIIDKGDFKWLRSIKPWFTQQLFAIREGTHKKMFFWRPFSEQRTPSNHPLGLEHSEKLTVFL